MKDIKSPHFITALYVMCWSPNWSWQATITKVRIISQTSYLIIYYLGLSLPGWLLSQVRQLFLSNRLINSLVFLPSFMSNKRKSIKGTVSVCYRIIFICFWPRMIKCFHFEMFAVPWPLHLDQDFPHIPRCWICMGLALGYDGWDRESPSPTPTWP